MGQILKSKIGFCLPSGFMSDIMVLIPTVTILIQFATRPPSEIMKSPNLGLQLQNYDLNRNCLTKDDGKILQKLDALDEDARVLAAIRAKKANVHLEQRKECLTTPLFFDLHMEPEGTAASSVLKTGAEIREDKSCGPKKSKTHVSFKCTPEHRSDLKESDSSALATDAHYEERPKEENLKLSPRFLYFLKDKTEAEYAMPFHVLLSEPRNQCKRSSESSILCPTRTNQSNANKNGNRAMKSMYSTDHSADSIKEGRTDHPLVNDFTAKENESVRDNQARSPRPVKQNILLPLHFEDVLKNPTIKIIDLGPTETVLYSTDTETVPTIKDRPGTKPIPSSSLDFVPFKAKESHTNPIIFHDKAYIMKLWLMKRFTPYVMTYTTKNVVLEKNCEMFKAMFYEKPSAVSKPQRTKAVAHYKDLHVFSTERVHKSIKEKRKKKHDSLASKKRPPDTLYNISRTFSILTKKIVGSFDKVALEEKSAKTGGFQRQFSRVRPPCTRKFTALPIKYDSKPLENILEICKLNNISPLDDLLSWKVNGS